MSGSPQIPSVQRESEGDEVWGGTRGGMRDSVEQGSVGGERTNHENGFVREICSSQ